MLHLRTDIRINVVATEVEITFRLVDVDSMTDKVQMTKVKTIKEMVVRMKTTILMVLATDPVGVALEALAVQAALEDPADPVEDLVDQVDLVEDQVGPAEDPTDLVEDPVDLEDPGDQEDQGGLAR